MRKPINEGFLARVENLGFSLAKKRGLEKKKRRHKVASTVNKVIAVTFVEPEIEVVASKKACNGHAACNMLDFCSRDMPNQGDVRSHYKASGNLLRQRQCSGPRLCHHIEKPQVPTTAGIAPTPQRSLDA